MRAVQARVNKITASGKKRVARQRIAQSVAKSFMAFQRAYAVRDQSQGKKFKAFFSRRGRRVRSEDLSFCPSDSNSFEPVDRVREKSPFGRRLQPPHFWILILPSPKISASSAIVPPFAPAPNPPRFQREGHFFQKGFLREKKSPFYISSTTSIPSNDNPS